MKNLKALHEFDLTTTLKNLGLLSKFNSKKIKCASCNTTIDSIENFGLIKKEDQKILCFCNDLDCIYLAQYDKRKRSELKRGL